MELGKKVFKPYWLQFVLPLVGFLFFATTGFLAFVYGNSSIALLLFCMAAPLLIVTIIIRSRRLIVWPEGIAQQSLFGREEMKWSDITDARYEISTTESVEHHISLISGHRGKIMKINPGYVPNESIVEFILTKVTSRKALQILDDINRGREVRYSKFIFTEDALRYKSREIPWKSLSSVKLIPSPPEYYIMIHSDTDEKPIRVLIMEYVSRNTVCELLDKQLKAQGKMGVVIA